MRLNKINKLVLALIFVLFSSSVFAATTDLSTRFLDKANEAYEILSDAEKKEKYERFNICNCSNLQCRGVSRPLFEESAWADPLRYRGGAD